MLTFSTSNDLSSLLLCLLDQARNLVIRVTGDDGADKVLGIGARSDIDLVDL